jgi:hypothetical protein
MFPEEATPFEILNLVPSNVREQIQQDLQAEESKQSQEWNRVNVLFRHTTCGRTNGRSYGDPHLRSFDGANYSFQTVGEFLLTRSTNGHLEIHTRQEPQSADFSLNTAVAMNVGGDRLTFYTQDTPDNSNLPFRLDGFPIQLQGRAFFLPKGGTVRLEGRNYIVTWPTGERVFMDKRITGRNSFTNVTVEIFRCDQNEFEGLLGNNNQSSLDDFNGRNNQSLSASSMAAQTFGGREIQSISNAMHKEHLNFIARDYADQWRIDNQNSLFEYAPGRDTEFYTDRSFPRTHHSVFDLPNDRRDVAARRCREMGVIESEMNGCIFDNGFLDISPNPIPSPTDPFANMQLKPLGSRRLNNNNFSWHDPNNPPLPIEQPYGSNTTKPEREPIRTDKPERENVPSEKPERENMPVEKPEKTPDATEKPVNIRVPASKPIESKPVSKPSTPQKPVEVKPSVSKPINTSPAVKPGKG